MSRDPSAAEQIFISYRRSDAQSTAGRIHDSLAAVFGPENLYFDLDSIPFGVDYRTYLETLLAECEYMIVIIGPDWLTASDHAGRRLDQADDWVRIEIETALRRGIPVAPVLIDGAVMPAAETLPESIRDLAYRNGGQIRDDPDYHADIERLIDKLVGPTRASGPAGSNDWPPPTVGTPSSSTGGPPPAPDPQFPEAPHADDRPPVVLAETVGSRALTDLDVAALAGIYSWANNATVTADQVGDLARRLTVAWQTADASSIVVALAGVDVAKRSRELLAANPLDATRIQQQVQSWMWDLQGGTTNAAYIDWMFAVGLAGPGDGSAHDNYIALANQSLADHVSRMRNYNP